ncbi:multidrug DMT transporter [Duganella dendranthematis]|uniref:Multidrug DMT transporter n=1 Tax=Duganella dendranthematis TaxID=2728021 RepID=A0ABX6MBT8_9BURK|nr:DNA circularization N-terminal domain-containing protein [Duganella dendranthematis]QJD91808.1 multidrug DMT transporter [Duganella dendranthematis]
MSIDQLTGGAQSLANAVSSGQNITNRLASDVGAGGGGDSGSWMSKLRPASFRGVPFKVLEGQLKFGRRSVIHEYPFRDTVWVEDLGRAARRIAFTGYIFGDDVIAQRDQLMKVCEEVGAVEGGELVHPTLGRITVSLADGVGCAERWDRGRVFELAFSFVEQGKRIFPNSTVDTQSAVSTAAEKAKAAAKANLISTAAGALKSGLSVVGQATSAVSSWARSAQRLVNDATNLYHFVQTMPGEFGRMFGSNATRSSGAATTVDSLVAQGAANRAKVAVAASKLSSTAGALAAVSGVAAPSSVTSANASSAVPPAVSTALSAYVDAVHALVAAVAAAAPSPPDALRLLAGLTAAAPAVPASLGKPVYPVSPVAPPTSAQAAALMAGATADLFRRAGVIELAKASASYKPSSSDDAVAVRQQVTQLLDDEMQVAADQGQDDSYQALHVVRTAVVQDLAARAADLASMVQVATPHSVPALFLAQRLYRDAARADQLIAEANPIHPAFMPPTFKALAR